jgi:hypothetical protein
MHGRRLGLTRLLGAGLMLGAFGCGDTGDDATERKKGEPEIPLAQTVASLAQASDCGDLLTKIQDDAIAKVKLAGEQAKLQRARSGSKGSDWPTSNAGFDEDSVSAEDSGDDEAESAPQAPVPGRGSEGVGSNPVGGKTPTTAPPTLSDGNAGTPSSSGSASSSGDRDDSAAPQDSADAKEESATGGGGGSVSGPTGASGTNKQVAEVDEADFVKVVQSGAGMFLLHGNTLQKLKTFPAAQTALEGTPLTIEGTPSEMFVTDAGKAVVFSSVYRSKGTVPGFSSDEGDSDEVCSRFGPCGGGGNALKVTIANVAANPPTVERELYYTGHYVSSRRYALAPSDVVRIIVQSNSAHYGLYQPSIMWQDSWGRPYDEAEITAQLAEWERRQTASIRNTKLEDWLPRAYERVGGKEVEIARQCESYYVPAAGLSEHGLTQVLSLDLAQPAQPVGGITVVGAASTVYSNTQRLVLAQPDYRFNEGSDFGIVSEERTALHVFDLAGPSTAYLASGWVSGHLPPHNPQFGIDVTSTGVVRVATTGRVRSEPTAKPNESRFWQTKTETHVITAQAEGNQLKELGRTPNLGLPRELLQSARFVGDRAYVVTFEQTDPLVAVDVSNPALPVELGQIKIPGFSQYMHPLDQNHLITVGMSAQRGIQLQLFDVTDPKNIPLPKVHDFGSGSSSEASYQHKAFTFYNGVLALPVSGSYSSADFRRSYYQSALQLVRVDPATGFTGLGTIDHSALYADDGKCGVCDEKGCYDYRCGASPEVRRGVFVSSESATYVYSFSYAGVLVNDLANLTAPVATVKLPAPVYSGVNGGSTDTDEPSPESKPRPARPPTVNPAPPTLVDASVVPTADAGTIVTVPDGAVIVNDASVLVSDGGVAQAVP